ncbi:hypothetical protein [Nonlabens ponticola]|uniref:Uncharacterized protein n=1 Tax=Nonlabens ponticola TaxID=2496866 RepID=A0A3S9MYR6_9FLAO|nr:hypothetical protein [Nonlabens ponticola]AZQ44242.1 hypothetical protein EJ995_08335 [Nonlabens ponticola]
MQWLKSHGTITRICIPAYALLLFVLLISCKDYKEESRENSVGETLEPDYKKRSKPDLYKNVTDQDTSLNETVRKVVEKSAELLENLEDDEEDYPEFVYLPFDSTRVLQYLGLAALNENRSVEALLGSNLDKGYFLKDDILETGDGTFNIYKLVYEDIDVAYFYHESGNITTIEIIDSAGVPDDMISPGHTFGELSATYENPVAYGSEIEARVFVNIGSIGFRMDSSYGIYEPIDLEDDTEILYIQF